MFENPIRWRKVGRVLTPRIDLWWNQTHISLPTVEVIDDEKVRVYFGGRDHLNRSRIGTADLNLADLDEPPVISPEPVLGLGELGTFDDNGVMPCSVVHHDGRTYLYYVGWNPRSTTRFSFYSGLAIRDEGKSEFTRWSRAPLLERTAREPFVNASPYVMRDGDIWRMYYVSGEGWIHPDLPKYNIKYAESSDGINWVREGTVCVDFGRPGEHALARPMVIRDRDRYRMWFAYKGSEFERGPNYRMGYAESSDGIVFERRDDLAGLDVSESGWDKDMVCYGFVFDANEKRWMIYNGNQYGMIGAGLAVAE